MFSLKVVVFALEIVVYEKNQITFCPFLLVKLTKGLH